MKILFLGDIVGNSGCEAVRKYLPKKIEEHQIDFGKYILTASHPELPTISPRKRIFILKFFYLLLYNLTFDHI